MVLARVALKNLKQTMAFVNPSVSQVKNVEKQKWCSELLRCFSTELETANGEGKSEVAVSESGKKSKLFPRRRRLSSLWRHRDLGDFAPVLFENLPSGLGSALLQVTENINRLFENLNMNPSQLMGRYKEDDKSYRIRYNVPGLGKEDVKIMVEDGILTIKGEHKEEKEGSDDDDESWSSTSYGYYNNSIVLPEDAKADDIKAVMKDGVLTITIPKSERPKKDVKKIQVM
ncbi:26.5 kDa heat shock protein, mitochondrial [Capsicum annuum]|uniref:26.5 kDa heat shock protein, mitochondrial n=1 Tax=Capsicum annuum TaxID=4072 RepID=A0A1U8H0F4_CAPAN|nr:26.5 kDa heat shock protein, mitochondrial [Capsicum annuum]KAF3642197.1 26.5 kDa heat shock protein, mitochondrial [Capsicum annuum]KAF3647185.1 26.5 kDa heat shock protein, mitochondrial [Capsicum annuum]PHT93745.1 26.5 kDa heat shock protein, mitochondrial [Capsicum annuum]